MNVAKRGPSKHQKFFQLVGKESASYKRLWIASHFWNMPMVGILNQCIAQVFDSIVNDPELTAEETKRLDALCVVIGLDPEKELEKHDGSDSDDTDAAGGQAGIDSDADAAVPGEPAADRA